MKTFEQLRLERTLEDVDKAIENVDRITQNYLALRRMLGLDNTDDDTENTRRRLNV